MSKSEAIIHSAEFIGSCVEVDRCPEPNYPEYAFIGRSNVGKSSLINMLTNHNGLARISSTPGKTQLINHFLINSSWYLVDLPGYGYAGVSQKTRDEFQNFTRSYFRRRPNLMCVFILIDSRIPLQSKDEEYMQWLAENEVPFVMIFTKIDKLTRNQLELNIKTYNEELLKNWEELPMQFYTSGKTKEGREELLTFIEETNEGFKV